LAPCTNPLTHARQLTKRLIQLGDKDAGDRRMMNVVAKRIGKALRQMVDLGSFSRTLQKVRGEFVWRTYTISEPACSGPRFRT